MAIKIVKVVEPLSLNPTGQAMKMIRKAQVRAAREGTIVPGATKVLIVVEQEFDDGN